MAAGEGFFAPVEWDGQNGQFDVIKLNGVMYFCLVERDKDGVNLLRVLTPLGEEKHRHDLSQNGVAHVFGVVAEPSRQSNTWKLVCLTFPPGKEFQNRRTVYFHDTGIPVDWAQVSG